MGTINMTLQNDIFKAVSVMKRGGVILYPTDTVWGIGCDATSSDAVRRVYEIKRRSDSKALISLVSDIAIPSSVADFLKKSDRPTTVVYPSCRLLAPELLADDGSAGIRVTSEIYSRGLCQELGVPVVSTSANISGEPAPALFSEISEEIISAVDYVADFRRDDSTVSAPSRVVKLNSDGSFIILRP